MLKCFLVIIGLLYLWSQFFYLILLFLSQILKIGDFLGLFRIRLLLCFQIFYELLLRLFQIISFDFLLGKNRCQVHCSLSFTVQVGLQPSLLFCDFLTFHFNLGLHGVNFLKLLFNRYFLLLQILKSLLQKFGLTLPLVLFHLRTQLC